MIRGEVISFIWCQCVGGSSYVLSGFCVINILDLLSRMNPQKYKAIVGTQQLLKGGKAYNIRKVVVHEKYDEENIKNDISLIFLEKEIQFSENVDAVELNNEPVAPGEKLLLTGWGTTSVSNNNHSS